jgi:hypothetical protein
MMNNASVSQASLLVTPRHSTMPRLFTQAKFLVLLLISASALSSCYSFTGASIPAGIHNIAIPTVEDVSGFSEAEIKQAITQTLATKFIREGSLHVTSKQNADVILNVTIEHISDEATGVSAGETLTNKQVTISATVVYFDQKKQKQFWQRDFSQSAVYAIAQSLDGLKTALTSAEDKLTDEIMLAVISNW